MNNKKFNSSLELIKYISILSMIIDHIGIAFYDYNEQFRFIGRFALIGFSFVLVYNYRFNTLDQRAYKMRLLKWAIISQVPYMLLISSAQLNILFLFLMGLYALDMIENLKHDHKYYFLLRDSEYNYTQAVSLIILSTLIIFSYFTGYYIFGVLTIVLMYYMHDSKIIYIPLLISVAMLNYSLLYATAAVSSLIMIYCIHRFIDLEIKPINGYLFYAFYPVHMIIIAAAATFSCSE